MVKVKACHSESDRVHAQRLTHSVITNPSLRHSSLSRYLIVIADTHGQGRQDKLQHGLPKAFLHFEAQSFQESCGALRTISGSVLKSNKTP